uniref:Uncharacterized protein n=1 Tax=Romanomermis culicivorax TaxID=13658 RepID=A0A915K101_ROMCU
MLCLPICRKLKVTNGATFSAHGPIIVTIRSSFREHLVKCVILDDDAQGQFIISIDSPAHPEINTILSFKEKFLEIQNVKMLLKVITSIKPIPKP